MASFKPVCTAGLVTPLIFVPFATVTPEVVDQYKLYAVAPLTAFQMIVACFVPPVALTPLGAAGMVGVGVVALVVAETAADGGPLR